MTSKTMKTKRNFGTSQRRGLLWALAIMVSSLLAARWVHARVHAQVDQQLLQLSRTFDELLDRSHLDLARPGQAEGSAFVIHFNGIEVRAEIRRVKATPQELQALFAALRSQCQAPLRPAAWGTAATWGAPILENSNPQETYLYCLQPHAPVTLESIGGLAEQFAASLDVAQLGQVRGLYARSRQDEHHLLMVQLEGAVDLDRAFSSTGDAPGHDFTDLPRPDGRRSTSISFNGAPELNVYRLPVDSEITLHTYAEQLKRRGVDLRSSPLDIASSQHALVARTAGNAYVVVLHPDASPHRGARLSITRLTE